MPDITTADFCIEINFEKGTENPSRIFRSMYELIETFKSIDIDLVNSIDSKIEPVAVIEDVQAGSVKAFLRYVLKSTDDESIKKLEWKGIVGNYLVTAKYLILDFIDGKTEITNREEVENLENKLLKLAEKTDIRHFPAYNPIERIKLLYDLEKMSTALSYLGQNDIATYKTSDNEKKMNAKFNIIPENIENLLTRETIKTIGERILKVKKPDYLGESKWDFHHGSRIINAKILDMDWLKKFQDREFDVRPGDSLRTLVEEQIKYGYDNDIVGISYSITKVIDIIRYNPPTQTEIPLSD